MMRRASAFETRSTSRLAQEVVQSGKAWVSTTRLGQGVDVLRACITNFRTDEQDIERLVSELNTARHAVREKLASTSNI